MLPSFFHIEPKHGGKSFNLEGLLEFVLGASLGNSLRPNFLSFPVQNKRTGISSIEIEEHDNTRL